MKEKYSDVEKKNAELEAINKGILTRCVCVCVCVRVCMCTCVRVFVCANSSHLNADAL